MLAQRQPAGLLANPHTILLVVVLADRLRSYCEDEHHESRPTPGALLDYESMHVITNNVPQLILASLAITSAANFIKMLVLGLACTTPMRPKNSSGAKVTHIMEDWQADPSECSWEGLHRPHLALNRRIIGAHMRREPRIIQDPLWMKNTGNAR